jgi:catechol 1,2-dioxygenase
VKPAGYPIPTHGPTGDLLRAQLRHPQRPAHLHFLCFKPGWKTLISQVFVADDPHLDSDVVFGVTSALVGDYQRRDDAPPMPDATTPWYKLEHRLVMEPGEAILPVPPVR